MLTILGSFEHDHSCSCRDCSPLTPALWLVEAALLEVNPGHRARKLMATTADYTIDDDPFIQIELLIAGVLATQYGVVAEQARHILVEAFRKQPLYQRDIDEALAKAEALLGDVFTPETEERIRHYVDELITKGAKDATMAFPGEQPVDPIPDPIPPEPGDKHSGLLMWSIIAGTLAGAFVLRNVGKGTVLEGSVNTQMIFQGIVASAKYYSNTYFTRVTLPEIQRRVQVLLDNPLAQPDPTDLIDFVGRRLISVPYWRVVANAAASRAYHYGAMKAGEMRGVRAYRLQAVLDERTSEICRELDGRVFWLADAVRLLEKAAVASVEELKNIMPWPRSVTGMTNEELRDMGVMVPPFHGNCRTTIVFIQEGQDR